jgi:chemotaxis protein MotB
LAVSTLTEITPILVNSNRPIDIEGHTDNRPIKNKEYSSNWELSALRATAVLRILNEEGLNDEHLSATGFAASRPIDSNESPQGRAKNRRVSIFVLQDSNALKP